MKTQLGKKLKHLLDNMSQEEFDKQWNEIVALDLQGPSFDDYLDYLANNTAFSNFKFEEQTPYVIQSNELSLAA